MLFETHSLLQSLIVIVSSAALHTICYQLLCSQQLSLGCKNQTLGFLRMKNLLELKFQKTRNLHWPTQLLSGSLHLQFSRLLTEESLIPIQLLTMKMCHPAELVSYIIVKSAIISRFLSFSCNRYS